MRYYVFPTLGTVSELFKHIYRNSFPSFFKLTLVRHGCGMITRGEWGEGIQTTSGASVIPEI